MNRGGTALRAAVVSGVTVLALAGCGNAVEGLAEGAVERALENEIGSSADVEVDEDGFTIDTDEGSISAGSGSVPEDFPADVPLPDGEVSFSQRLETADGLGWSVVIATSGEAGSVGQQIRSDLENNGFDVEESTQFSGEGGSGGTILAERSDLSVLVVVTADDSGETLATYTVSETPAQ